MKANEDQEAGRAGLREHFKPGALLGPPCPPPLALLSCGGGRGYVHMEGLQALSETETSRQHGLYG